MLSARAIVVASSAGGITALRTLLSGLPGDFAVPVVIVQHTGAQDVSGLCEVLQDVSALPVQEAQARGEAQPGTVYVAPAGYHLLLERDGRFALSVDEKVCHVRPAADVLFDSAALAFGPGLTAVVLTGSNEDGAEGLCRVRQKGGYAIVQDPESAEAPEMPRAALERAGADLVLPIEHIADALIERIRSAPSDTNTNEFS